MYIFDVSAKFKGRMSQANGNTRDSDSIHQAYHNVRRNELEVFVEVLNVLVLNYPRCDFHVL